MGLGPLHFFTGLGVSSSHGGPRLISSATVVCGKERETMFGFIIGGVCLAGLIAMRRRARWGGGCGSYGYQGGGACGSGHRGWGGHHGGWGGHHRGGGVDGDFVGDGMLRGLYRKLDTTPGQEKVIAEAFGELRTALRGMKDEMGRARDGIGKAVAGETFDGAPLDEAFARQDVQLKEVQRAVSDALRKAHEVLDERQRKELVSILERFGFLRGEGAPFGAGPYRA